MIRYHYYVAAVAFATALVGTATFASAADDRSISQPYKPQRRLSPISPFRPPYAGTGNEIDVFYASDVTTYQGYTYKGMEFRRVFDRRNGGSWVFVNCHIYDVTYDNSNNSYNAVSPTKTIEFVVHNEFLEIEGQQWVQGYGPEVGTMPAFLLNGMDEVWILPGDEYWGGGWDPAHILIHTGDVALGYQLAGTVQEILIHEACHAVLDKTMYDDPAWSAAANDDGRFISDYAEAFPDREDIAETVLPWLAAEYLSDRLPAGEYDIITTAIPNRIDYLNNQNFDVSPLPYNTPAPTTTPSVSQTVGDPTAEPSLPPTRATTGSPTKKKKSKSAKKSKKKAKKNNGRRLTTVQVKTV